MTDSPDLVGRRRLFRIAGAGATGLPIGTRATADRAITDRKPYTPGEEGVQDHRLIEAIRESPRSGRPVRLPAMQGLDAFRGPPPKEDS